MIELFLFTMYFNAFTLFLIITITKICGDGPNNKDYLKVAFGCIFWPVLIFYPFYIFFKRQKVSLND